MPAQIASAIADAKFGARRTNFRVYMGLICADTQGSFVQIHRAYLCRYTGLICADISNICVTYNLLPLKMPNVGPSSDFECVCVCVCMCVCVCVCSGDFVCVCVCVYGAQQ